MKDYSFTIFEECMGDQSCLTLLPPHGLQLTRLLCIWDFTGKNTGVGCYFLLQGTFLTQGLDLHLHLLTKVHVVKTMVFPVVMCGCESWTTKKAKHQRTDAFKLWYWKRLLRIPWTARRSNQLILKEISPEYSLEGLMLKLQSFGHLM